LGEPRQHRRSGPAARGNPPLAGASGTFTIPPAILANLPASQPAPTVPAPSLWLSYLPFQNQRPLHASGLGNGLAISLFLQTLEVLVR
jgi:hypothetical protein